MKKNKSAFTMIELLMVMMITSVLGAVALPYFLDFRKEARIAALQQNLAALRVGIKNQRLQAKLKCNYNGDGTEAVGTMTSINMNWLWGNQILMNDVTFFSSLNGVPISICTTAQIPNPEERKFLMDGLPRNPFTSSQNPPFIYIVDPYWMTVFGSHCGVAAFCSLNGESWTDWGLDSRTGEIFPCSDTPGVNECNF